MKIRIALVASMVGTLFASSAFADEVAGVSASAEKKFNVGVQAEMLPVGSLELGANGKSDTTDLKLSYGVGLNLSYDVTPNISVGLAPRYIFGIQSDEAQGDDTGEELDLRARLTAHFPVAPGLQVFGFAAPGYSWLLDNSEEEDFDNPEGFVLGFGGGATYDVSPNLYVSAEVGYQLGFQGFSADTPIGTVDADTKTNFLDIGIGVGTRF